MTVERICLETKLTLRNWARVSELWKCLLGWIITRGVRRYMSWYMAYVSGAGRGKWVEISISSTLLHCDSHLLSNPSIAAFYFLSPSINGLLDNYTPRGWPRNGRLRTRSRRGVGRFSAFRASYSLYTFRCVRIAGKERVSAAASRGRLASLYACAFISTFWIQICLSLWLVLVQVYCLSSILSVIT